MKIKNFIVLFGTLFIGGLGFGQNPLKIGHVNIQELVQAHKSVDSIMKVLDKETKDLEGYYNEMVKEHEQKLEIFNKEKAGYSEIVKKSKEDELISIARKIQEFNADAQEKLQKRNMELMRPVYDQINSIIKDIAGKEQFTYILDTSSGSVAYVSPDSQDLNPRIKAMIKPSLPKKP